MNILALDIATKTGWRTRTASGVWDFKLKADDSKGMRLISFEKQLRATLKKSQINLVVFESYVITPKQANAAHVSLELQGVLKLVCEHLGIEYTSRSPKEIKKFATGNGNASKDAMLEGARLRWAGIDVIDHNHADALWLYDLAEKLYGNCEFALQGAA